MSKQVGIEVEFAGLEFTQAAGVIAEALQCEPRVISPHENTFTSAHGDYRLEVDFALLKSMSREEHEADNSTLLQRATVGALELAASVATPLELVSPPLPVAKIEDFANMLTRLAEAGALGTKSSMVYAFGVHFNPSAELTAASITAHLRAFMCLYLWLKDHDEMDFTRDLSAFARPFSEDYERLVLAPDYAPDIAALIDAYIEHNPSRNRALDLLPLFAEIDESRVRAAIHDERINARPTYHYRLPNSRIDEPEWTVLQPWRDWLEVERLAHDAGRLDALCQQRLTHLDKGLLARDEDWISTCQEHLRDR